MSERLYLWSRERPWLVDGVLALGLAAVLGLASFAIISPALPLAWRTALSAAVVVGHLALVARRVWPSICFATVSAAMAVQALAPLDAYRYDTFFLPSAVVFPVALYTVCLVGAPWQRRLALAVGTAGALMLTGRAVWAYPRESATTPGGVVAWLFLFGFLLVVVFASWGFARLRQERMRLAERERDERARDAATVERNRIAREMHDVVAHSLSVIITQAQGGALIAAKSPERAAQVLGTIATTGRQALTEMRGVLRVLRAERAEGGPQPTLDEVPALLDGVRDAGLNVRMQETSGRVALGPSAQLAVYRLIQEALKIGRAHV